MQSDRPTTTIPIMSSSSNSRSALQLPQLTQAIAYRSISTATTSSVESSCSIGSSYSSAIGEGGGGAAAADTDTAAGSMGDLVRTGEVVPTTLNNLASMIRIGANEKERHDFPTDYIPGEWDICCGRGKRNWNHQGNVTFRQIIQSNVARYIDAPTKKDKTEVVVSIVEELRQDGANFLKQDEQGLWYDIGDAQAREKVGHSLRDQVTAISRTAGSKRGAGESRQDSVDEDDFKISSFEQTTAPASPKPITTNFMNFDRSIKEISDKRRLPTKAPNDVMADSFAAIRASILGEDLLLRANKKACRRMSTAHSDSGNDHLHHPRTLSEFSSAEPTTDDNWTGRRRSKVMETFERRPSWLATSLSDSTMSSMRASVLLNEPMGVSSWQAAADEVRRAMRASFATNATLLHSLNSSQWWTNNQSWEFLNASQENFNMSIFDSKNDIVNFFCHEEELKCYANQPTNDGAIESLNMKDPIDLLRDDFLDKALLDDKEQEEEEEVDSIQ